MSESSTFNAFLPHSGKYISIAFCTLNYGSIRCLVQPRNSSTHVKSIIYFGVFLNICFYFHGHQKGRIYGKESPFNSGCNRRLGGQLPQIASPLDPPLHITLLFRKWGTLTTPHVLSTMGVSKKSISKFFIGNRFKVKLRILSPCKDSLEKTEDA